MQHRINFQVKFILAVQLFSTTTFGDEIDFNRDVRPILSGKCFACHGPDATSLQGGLRLDLPDSVTSPAESGKTAIVPGDPEMSELVRRITAFDVDVVMPPPDSHKALKASEKAVLRKWVLEGAKYKQHWSFLMPERHRAAPASNFAWNKNDIDPIVFAELQKRGMTPSPEADPLTLIRRVSLDLRGLPPTIAEIDEFTADTSDNGYERLVDRMFQSPHFGERMAMVWLDLARYGDTNGYHADSDRPVWVWRDWVVDAFNSNMPFDQFTIWQLGGDLLPNVTVEQKIASGFNRNVRFNEEGGADPAEFLAAYAADRAITMGRIWLGLTLNCAQCHSHKYDPVSQKEFYQLTAFFNSLEEEGAGGVTGFHGKPVPPVLRVQTRLMKEELARASEQLAQITASMTLLVAKAAPEDPNFSGDPRTEVAGSQLAWEAAVAGFEPPPAPIPTARWDFRKGVDDLLGERDGTLLAGASIGEAGLILDGQAAHVITAPITIDLGAKTLEAWVRLSNLTQAGGAVIGVQTLIEDPSGMSFDAIVFGEREPGRWMAGSNSFNRTQPFSGDPETEADKQFVHIAIAYDEDGTIRCYRQGRPYGQAYRKSELQNFKAGAARIVFGARALPPGANYMLAGTIREARMYDRALSESEIAASAEVASSGVPATVLAVIQTPRDLRAPEQSALLRDYYLRHIHAATREALKQPQQDAQILQDRIASLTNEQHAPLQMVSVEMAQPKPAFVLMRGDFQTPGESVTRDVPAFLPPFAEDLPQNRLGLARWLMQANQPLVARVQVNRFWQLLFGEGLVRSMGDFGLQGEFPSHLELLDLLALDFIESGWDVKQTLRQIVMSRTYRQSSSDTRRYAEIDPQNKLLWRAPRVRLQAEIVRDNSLAASGLLTRKMGGPPVFPYQPADFYKGKNNGWPWNMSPGEDLYRRGLYTFWRRTTPYPTFVIFDAPDRAECTFERPRTNTPLQALVTLNDPQFVEAARVLAQRLLVEAPSETDARITLGYRLSLSRPPSSAELLVLRNFVDEQLAYYQLNPDAAKSLIANGQALNLGDLSPIEHAAWTATANVLLNLDEMITRN
ncbi:MAG: DUF1553 domain-containing protein [Planctomycetota bacterium]|nr:MAG: DUF1553 domain-containing protein [Planctomycetota bacterium]